MFSEIFSSDEQVFTVSFKKISNQLSSLAFPKFMLPFWNLQKISIFFRTAKTTVAGSMIFSWHSFCKTVRKEQKQGNVKGTYYNQLASCEEIVSSSNKEHIKWVICGAAVFLLFWLHLDSQSFRIVRKILLPYPALMLLMYKINLKLLLI